MGGLPNHALALKGRISIWHFSGEFLGTSGLVPVPIHNSVVLSRNPRTAFDLRDAEVSAEVC